MVFTFIVSVTLTINLDPKNIKKGNKPMKFEGCGSN